MGFFAVMDTETNWCDAVMSIGIVIADENTLSAVDSRYYVLAPECEIGGMYSGVMDLVPEKDTIFACRREAMADIRVWLEAAGITKIFAYNACFDCKHMPELSWLSWYDIMRIAAYRQHNPYIPATAPCCRTGRLKSHYGVEPMLRLLTHNPTYAETHNALYDAVDELTIMKLLRLELADYECARI